MTTKSKKLQPIWEELQDILLNEKQFNKQKERLENLGFKVVRNKGKHPKIHIQLEKLYIVTVSATPSDNYAGRQMLRTIRRIYEGEEKC